MPLDHDLELGHVCRESHGRSGVATVPAASTHEDAAALRKMAAASSRVERGLAQKGTKIETMPASRSIRHEHPQELTRSLTFRRGTGARSTLLQPASSARSRRIG